MSRPLVALSIASFLLIGHLCSRPGDSSASRPNPFSSYICDCNGDGRGPDCQPAQRCLCPQEACN